MARHEASGAVPAVPAASGVSVGTIVWPALAMMMVASVGSIAQLSDSATFGLGAVTVYLIPALLFLLPVGLVSAELATSHEGGIFVWVREAFGDRTGFQATWFVFMNSVTLYPSLLSFGAAALATAFGRPDLAGNGLYMGTVVLVGFWLATFVVSKGMQTTAGLSNLGVGLGTIVPAFALIFFMFAWLIDDKPSAAPLHLSDITPPFDGLSSIALVVGTFVAFAGLEVNAVHIKHLKGRPRSYFKAVLSAALLVFVMYLLGSIAISVAVPDSTLELTSGASQAFTVYADGFGIPALSNILSGLLVLGAVAASIAWIAGPSRSMWLVGRAGYLPQRFQRTNKNDVQMPILLFQGVIVTILSLVFVVAPNTSVAFAMLQDISISLYMLHVHLHVRRRDPAPPLAAGRGASDPDHRAPGDRDHRHPRGPVGHRPGADPTGRLQCSRGRPVRRSHRRWRHRPRDSQPSCCTASVAPSGRPPTRRSSSTELEE